MHVNKRYWSQFDRILQIMSLFPETTVSPCCQGQLAPVWGYSHRLCVPGGWIRLDLTLTYMKRRKMRNELWQVNSLISCNQCLISSKEKNLKNGEFTLVGSWREPAAIWALSCLVHFISHNTSAHISQSFIFSPINGISSPNAPMPVNLI